VKRFPIFGNWTTGFRLPFGLLEDDDTNLVYEITPRFWPGAKFHCHRNAATSGGFAFIDVRLKLSGNPAATSEWL
jgi:hypothetical protein